MGTGWKAPNRSFSPLAIFPASYLSFSEGKRKEKKFSFKNFILGSPLFPNLFCECKLSFFNLKNLCDTFVIKKVLTLRNIKLKVPASVCPSSYHFTEIVTVKILVWCSIWSTRLRNIVSVQKGSGLFFVVGIHSQYLVVSTHSTPSWIAWERYTY